MLLVTEKYINMLLSESLDGASQIPLSIALRLRAFCEVSDRWGSKLFIKRFGQDAHIFISMCVLAGALFVLADPHAKGCL